MWNCHASNLQSSMTYRVIFVTRRYDGVHIGKKRFEAYLLAARSAVANYSHLPNKNVTHNPWSEEYCKFSDTTFTNGKLTSNYTRGRGRGRGNNRWRRGQWTHRRTGRGALPGYYREDRKSRQDEWGANLDPSNFDEDGFPVQMQ